MASMSLRLIRPSRGEDAAFFGPGFGAAGFFS
jgi:hypothetical protein